MKTMNKINKLFQEKKNNLLSIYFTAGFPKLNDTAVVLEQLEKNGVDMIEIGIPFSDPLADGQRRKFRYHHSRCCYDQFYGGHDFSRLGKRSDRFC